MLGPSWLLAAAVLCYHSPSVDSHCSGLTDCMSLQSNEQKLQCVRQCGSEQQSPDYDRLPSSEGRSGEEEQMEEERVSLGQLLSALSPDSEPPRSDERPYIMEHFRWGKPILLTPQSPDSKPPRSEERRSYSMEHFRWGKPMGRKRRPVKVFTDGTQEEETEEPEESEESVRVERGQEIQQRNNGKSSGKYRMTHFRWNAPPDKRYGGFIRPYVDQSHKPLLTLIRNIMVKDGQQSRN